MFAMLSNLVSSVGRVIWSALKFVGNLCCAFAEGVAEGAAEAQAEEAERSYAFAAGLLRLRTVGDELEQLCDRLPERRSDWHFVDADAADVDANDVMIDVQAIVRQVIAERHTSPLFRVRLS